MLNGIDPLLIITLKNKGIIDLFSQGIFADTLGEIGLPIPIYLSEKLTGIYIDSETRGLDVSTRVDPVTTKNPATGDVESAEISQTCLDAQVTINMLARNDSIMLTAILALMQLIVDRLVSAEYSITYLNGSTVIFGGLLHRFATSVSKNDNLVRIELSLSTAVKQPPTAKVPVQAIDKVASVVHP